MYRTTLSVLLAAAALLSTACTPSSALVRPDLVACNGELALPSSLRVVSYNMHAGVSSSLDEIARVIEELDADVVALQEVDRGVGRSGEVDQDVVLAEKLGYHTAFAAARRRESGDFGVAILSRLPFTRVERIDLHEAWSSQPRVALDASVCMGTRAVRILNVHADVWPWASNAATKRLLRSMAPSLGEGVILAGDLNVVPGSAGPRWIKDAGLHDLVARFGEAITFRNMGARRIDYIFADAFLAGRAGSAGVVVSEASDHYPIFGDFAFEDLALAP